eukprot:1981740-Rhodomonas_salina.1
MQARQHGCITTSWAVGYGVAARAAAAVLGRRPWSGPPPVRHPRLRWMACESGQGIHRDGRAVAADTSDTSDTSDKGCGVAARAAAGAAAGQRALQQQVLQQVSTPSCPGEVRISTPGCVGWH